MCALAFALVAAFVSHCFVATSDKRTEERVHTCEKQMNVPLVFMDTRMNEMRKRRQ